MKTLTYIYHDCFVYEDKETIIVFDYWTDPLSANKEEPRFLKEASKDKHLIVLVSHHHKDHYSKDIFAWEKKFNKITYVLSGDTAKFCRHLLKQDTLFAGTKPSPENVIILKPGEKAIIEGIEVEAFDSSDIGNSYALNIEGTIVFHAGDLNAWIWKDESTEKEVSEAIENFNVILEKIAAKYPKIDVAMFPVDARIGRDYFTGAKMFVREIDVKRFFPMHFELADSEDKATDFKIAATRFSDYANPERGEYIGLIYPYSSYGWS